MLKELRIKNFALIDFLTVSFHPGLNILTGETGAGKTILINALNLILGSRASSEFIRTGSESAEVEASFHIEKDHPIYSILDSSGYSFHPDDDLIIRRIIFQSEKANRCYLNGHPVPLSLLVNIGNWLVDIHGQHEHQFLLNSANHLEILDRFGRLKYNVEQVSTAYFEYKEAMNKFEELMGKVKEIEMERDLILSQKEEIDHVKPVKGEEETLLHEGNLLAKAAKIQELVMYIDNVLYQAEGSVYEKLGEVSAKVQELSDLDQQLKLMSETVNSILIQIEEITHQLRSYISKKDFSPHRLEEIEERLDQISRLKKKYRLSLDDLIRFREQIEDRWQVLEDYETLIQKYSAEVEKKLATLKDKSSQLSEKRRYWAKLIEKEIEGHLDELQINKAKFIINFYDPVISEAAPSKGLTSRGWDDIEFVFSANLGENPKPLSKIASGGEISRIMLAFKSCLAQADQVSTLVFDEIDTGIGGKAAISVGKKMKNLALKCQTICITHMPQIACNADSHYLVSKRIKNGRTITVVNQLSKDCQIEELAKMIAGDGKSEIAKKHAIEMLERAASY